MAQKKRARRKKARKAASRKKFHVDLNASNWPDFTGDTELQDFLDSHVSGVVNAKARKGGRKSVNLVIALEPKSGASAASKTDVASISICKRPPC